MDNIVATDLQEGRSDGAGWVATSGEWKSSNKAEQNNVAQ